MTGFPFTCDKCKRFISSFLVMPIHQHDPKCPDRLKWEKENPTMHPGFHGKEWKEVVDQGKKEFYQK